MGNYITLVEKHIIRESSLHYKELDRLCFLSKNLYNSTLYSIRQHYFSTKKYLDYYKVGSYQFGHGGLDSPTTNQRLYKIENGNMRNITSLFWEAQPLK